MLESCPPLPGAGRGSFLSGTEEFRTYFLCKKVSYYTLGILFTSYFEVETSFGEKKK